ncbi:MAG: SusC/RagA family protein, partial [Bacteroidetes bacterium]
MKKTEINHERSKNYLLLLKMIRIMKLSIILLAVSFVQVFATTTYSQKAKINLDLKNTMIKDVLANIESQSEFYFLYSPKMINDKKKVDIRVSDKKIDFVLKQLFADSNTDYIILDRQIVISDKMQIAPFTQSIVKQINISGSVTDTEGNSIPGVNVSEAGTSNGTVTDLEGNFSISVTDENAVLNFSFIGYVSQSITVGSKTTIDVVLKEDTETLDEIVITGYTAERKSDLTGAVAIVDMDQVISQPVSNVNNMLQGRVAGVNVMSSGSPGDISTLRIRGFSTIRNNDPLYVIDGVPTTSGLSLINPNDIESLQVLKDASSSTIYGSRAANGVVIITTKKGKKGKSKLSFNMYTGVQNTTNLPRMLNAQEYGDVYWQAFGNDGIAPSHAVYGDGASPVIPAYLDVDNTIPSADTKWVEEVFNPAIIQSYDLSISQGNEKSSSLFSLSYFDQEGTLKHTNFSRITARLNSDYKLFDGKVTVGENLTVAFSNRVGTSTNSLLGNVVYDAFRIPSIAPVYDNKGEFTGYPLSDVQNPLGNLVRNKDNEKKNVRVFGNVFAEIQLFDGLKFKTNFGVNYTTFKNTTFNPTYVEPNAHRAINDLSVGNQVKFDWVWSNTLNYTKTFNEKHNVGVLLGLESIVNTFEYTTASVNDLPTNELNIRVLNAGDQGTQTNTGDKVEFALFSYFGKINYNYDNKYLFSATIRRDGTSKLLNNRWGTFPAFSAGWRISEEDFFNKDGVLSNLKLRVGWGKTGNQDIPAYQTVSGFNSNPWYSNYAIDGSQNSTQTGFTLSRIANPDLKWETTTQTNIGLEFGLLNNSLNIIADYFIKNTEDLLLFQTLSPDAGLTNRGQWNNVGEMENKGFEFDINYQSDRNKDFSFNIGLNFAIIDNKLISLGEGTDFIETDPAVLHSINFDQSTSRTEVGQPIASFYGHVVDGIFQTDAEAASSNQPNALAGDFIFKDLNGDGVIDADDRTYIGS